MTDEYIFAVNNYGTEISSTGNSRAMSRNYSSNYTISS